MYLITTPLRQTKLRALPLILTGTKLGSFDQLKKKKKNLYKGIGRAETRENWKYVKISNTEKKLIIKIHDFVRGPLLLWKQKTGMEDSETNSKYF